MYNHSMALSLNDETFTALKNDFDGMIGRTIGNMEMKGADEATITIKLGVSLEKMSVPVENGVKEIVRPTFKHDISSVMQVKDKVSGQLKGDYELVYDKESGTYFMRRVEDGQMNMFEGEGKVVDADFKDIPAIGEGQRGLPAAAQEAGFEEWEDGQGDADGAAPEAATEFASRSGDAYDPETPFGWLRQFVGRDMRVTEAMGNFTVRTTENKVVLSSATGSESPFYCPAEKLEGHAGHAVTCLAHYAEATSLEEPGELTGISVVCDECNETLFRMDATGLDAYPGEDDEGTGSYEYDPPEREGDEE